MEPWHEFESLFLQVLHLSKLYFPSCKMGVRTLTFQGWCEGSEEPSWGKGKMVLR